MCRHRAVDVLGKAASEAGFAQDYGFMYSRDIDDPDGNSLGFLYVTLEAMKQGPDQVGESA